MAAVQAAFGLQTLPMAAVVGRLVAVVVFVAVQAAAAAVARMLFVVDMLPVAHGPGVEHTASAVVGGGGVSDASAGLFAAKGGKKTET